MEWYVYIIQSTVDGSYYVGHTHDVDLRLIHHNDGWTRSTKSGRPWKLVYCETCKSKSEAIGRERGIKWSRPVPTNRQKPIPRNGILDSAIRGGGAESGQEVVPMPLQWRNNSRHREVPPARRNKVEAGPPRKGKTRSSPFGELLHYGMVCVHYPKHR